MPHEGMVLLAALVWLGGLFGVALWGERHPQAFASRWGERGSGRSTGQYSNPWCS